ncbi:hypothetical protein PR202_ga02837 [Eleusine coracana subsp. coracana]|uniref:Peptidase M24 domain-containing protein n=1 Tax=Eleusine coracana subsp. coracana TaxID=191504 RepID=A0AAV5BMQ9_ELECO|nr:hypothetical protein PR202_ga02837 [Eleusine coracana subsp. coracana]
MCSVLGGGLALADAAENAAGAETRQHCSCSAAMASWITFRWTRAGRWDRSFLALKRGGFDSDSVRELGSVSAHTRELPILSNSPWAPSASGCALLWTTEPFAIATGRSLAVSHNPCRSLASLDAARATAMASQASPRFLSTFLGDRLALSANPHLLRSGTPGTGPTAPSPSLRGCPRVLVVCAVRPEQKVPSDGSLLQDGDIINIDVTVFLNGYHGDTSATFFCGDVDDEAKKLVQVTKECLDKAISICAPGVEIKRIGRTIQDHADKFKYGVVRHFVGHGVGKVFHAEPVVLHFREFFTFTNLFYCIPSSQS